MLPDAYTRVCPRGLSREALLFVLFSPEVPCFGRYVQKGVGGTRLRYLVDPDSSHMLVSKMKPLMHVQVVQSISHCLSLSLNQLSLILLYHYYLDNRSNSRANTCEKSRPLEGKYLLD